MQHINVRVLVFAEFSNDITIWTTGYIAQRSGELTDIVYFRNSQFYYRILPILIDYAVFVIILNMLKLYIIFFFHNFLHNIRKIKMKLLIYEWMLIE